jgi:transcriptional regulator with XRE-family HTH domain
MIKNMIGDRIRSARKDKGWTQSQLSELVATSLKTLSAYEVGRNEPDLESLDKIAKAMDLTIEDLLSYDISPNMDRMQKEAKLLYDRIPTSIQNEIWFSIGGPAVDLLEDEANFRDDPILYTKETYESGSSISPLFEHKTETFSDATGMTFNQARSFLFLIAMDRIC